MTRSLVWLAAITLTACGGATKKSELPQAPPVELAPATSTDEVAPLPDQPTTEAPKAPPPVTAPTPQPMVQPTNTQKAPRTGRRPADGSPTTKKTADPCEGGE